MKVVFNKRFHLGRWYEAGEIADIRERIAKRFINSGVLHPAPEIESKPEKIIIRKPAKEEKVKVAEEVFESKAIKKKEFTPSKVQSRGYSGYSNKYSKKMD